MIEYDPENRVFPFHQIQKFYDNIGDFTQELGNYLTGGVVISTPTMFAMGKPIDSSLSPDGQWYSESADTWYVKWFAGQGSLRAIMDAVCPLPKVAFRRTRNGKESELKTYNWNRLYKLTGE